MAAPDPPEYPDSSSLPPFDFYCDAAFDADMAVLAPDNDIREDIYNDLEWTLTRVLLGAEAPPGLSNLGDNIQSQLLLTEKTGIAPALRIVFSVTGEHPNRQVSFHAASLRDQNGDG